MGSKFIVIQFVPDPVADERLNAGVIAFDESIIRVKFTGNWSRLKKFSSADLDFFKEFARDLEARVEPLCTANPLTHAELDFMVRKWCSLIQFTPPRGSLLAVDDLLAYAFKRFMTSETAGQKRSNLRSALKQHAKSALKKSIDLHCGVHGTLKTPKSISVEGELASYDFQVGIVNARPRLVAEAFSFADGQHANLAREIRATAWAFNDIRRHSGQGTPRLSVLVDKRDESLAEFTQARHFFESLNVEMIDDNQIEDWADDVVKEIAADSH